jgi:hypothetical protein
MASRRYEKREKEVGAAKRRRPSICDCSSAYIGGLQPECKEVAVIRERHSRYDDDLTDQTGINAPA